MSRRAEPGHVPPRRWSTVLGPDLAALTEEVGTELTAVSVISRLPPRHTGRASFRLRFSRRRFLKGLRCELPTAPARIAALLPLLPACHFPQVIARRGDALLIDWVPGVPLRARDYTTALLRQCGALHAAIHLLPVPEDAAALSRRSPDWQHWLDVHLRELVSARALTTSEAGSAMSLAERHAPTRTHRGICHGDFCAENVVHARGRFAVVDNETVAVDACEYDLARTWYRWRMTPPQRAVYLQGYEERPALRSFRAHVLHFAVVVLAESAAYRLRVRARSARVPLRRLHALLSRPDVVSAA